MKSVFDHELGHRIDELLHVSQQLGSKDWYQEAIVLGAGYIKDNLSKYAMTNLKEFVAEALSLIHIFRTRAASARRSSVPTISPWMMSTRVVMSTTTV